MRSDAAEDGHAGETRRGLSAIGLPFRFGAAAVVIAGLALAAHLRAPAPPVVPRLSLVPPPARVMAAPLRLTEPGIDPVRVEPGRIDPQTGLREDVLGRGSFTAVEAPVLRLAVTRGDGAQRAPSLFVLLARRAALAAPGELPLAVMRTGARRAVATRFGTAEIAEATLVGPITRTCVGFVVAQAVLRIDGFLCGPLGRAPEPEAVACTIDSLKLDDPADQAATATFRQARGASACEIGGTATSDPANRTGSIDRRRADTKN